MLPGCQTPAVSGWESDATGSKVHRNMGAWKHGIVTPMCAQYTSVVHVTKLQLDNTECIVLIHTTPGGSMGLWWCLRPSGCNTMVLTTFWLQNHGAYDLLAANISTEWRLRPIY